MLYLLDPQDPRAPFPNVEMAEREPDGLLAVGGDLSATRLVNAIPAGGDAILIPLGSKATDPGGAGYASTGWDSRSSSALGGPRSRGCASRR